MSKKHIIGMGAALVDIIAPMSDTDLQNITQKIGNKKGTMTLIDNNQATAIAALLKKQEMHAGGSVANSIDGISKIDKNIATAFIGKIGDDTLGQFFKNATAAQNTDFSTTPSSLPTGHCISIITPDGERTMHTHLGASTQLSEADIPQSINTATIFFGEAYLWDSPTACAAFLSAAQKVRQAGGRVALSLGDSGVCARHRKTLWAALEYIDILLGNTDEAASLLNRQDKNMPQMLNDLLAEVETIALTQGAQGVYVASHKESTHHIPATPITEVIDSTGAGDQFAAGFLAGLLQDKSIIEAGTQGVYYATQIIQKFGARY